MKKKKVNYSETLMGFLFLVGIIVFSTIDIQEAFDAYNRIESIKFEVSSPLDGGDFITGDGRYLIKMEDNLFYICRPDTKEVIKSFQLSGDDTSFTPWKIYDAFISDENRRITVSFYPLLGGENAYNGYTCVLDDNNDKEVFTMIKD